MYFHLILFSSTVAFPLMLLLLLQREKNGYEAHNVCSSATPVFNFLTWKTFLSKETVRQTFSHEERDPHPMSLFLPFTWPLLCECTPCFPACCVTCGSCGSLFYTCWLLSHWPSLCCGRCWNSSQTPLFTLAAAGCHIPCLRLLASPHICRACCFILGLLLHFNCACAAVIFRPPGTEQYMANTLQKGEDLANLMFLLALNKNFKLPQASGLHSYQPAFRLCFSYLIFYWAFICVYREKNKAVFVNIYGFSQELLPDVISLFLSFCWIWDRPYIWERLNGNHAACIQHPSVRPS